MHEAPIGDRVRVAARTRDDADLVGREVAHCRRTEQEIQVVGDICQLRSVRRPLQRVCLECLGQPRHVAAGEGAANDIAAVEHVGDGQPVRRPRGMLRGIGDDLSRSAKRRGQQHAVPAVKQQLAPVQRPSRIARAAVELLGHLHRTAAADRSDEQCHRASRPGHICHRRTVRGQCGIHLEPRIDRHRRGLAEPKRVRGAAQP